MRAPAFLVVLMLGMSPGAAAAEGPNQTPAAPASSVDPAWYGWQAIIADALGGGLLALSSQIPGPNGGVAVAVLGVTDLVVTAPLIHVAHAQAGRAGISVGMRLGLPLLGGLLGVAVGGSTCQPPAASPGAFDFSGLDCLGAQIGGALVGAGGGMHGRSTRHGCSGCRWRAWRMTRGSGRCRRWAWGGRSERRVRCISPTAASSLGSGITSVAGLRQQPRELGVEAP